MDDLDREMKMSFIDEARQLLEAAEQCFLDLETAGESPEIIENIFRLAHNMKGTSRAVGFGEVAEFTHQFENLLLKLKQGALAVDAETVTLLLACNDHLKEMVDGLSLDLNAKFDSKALMVQLVSKIEGRSIGVADASAAQTGQETQEQSPENSTEKNSEAPSHAESFQPGIEMVEDDPNPMDHAPQFPGAGQAAPTATGSGAGGGGGGGGGRKPTSGGGGGGSGNQHMDESIRVSLGRLERLSNFIGELVILQTVLNQHRGEIKSQLLQRTVQQLGKLSKEIQDISMSLRMIPLKQTFAKLQRIVRDTSKALDKEVELSIYGDHTEVDKTVLEQVSDPLVHIVRNAVDHGLEPAAERIQVGKSKEGRVMIRAYHQGNNLVIEVTDDGKGLDPKRLMKKAIEKGIISPSTQLSDSEAIHLIFHPGFSTKDQVSEISGRGVGLDVVKTNVERLGGQVQLESDLGAGSCFRILLPLTLAIIDGMVVQSGDDRYVIPIANVHETVQPRKEDITFVTGRGEMLSLRDSVLPLFRLSTLLRTNTKNQKEPWQCIAIIANSRRQPFAVLVDDILRQQQIVIKKLGAEIRMQKGLAGSAILGDGRPSLILDLNELVDYAVMQSKGGGVRSTFAA